MKLAKNTQTIHLLHEPAAITMLSIFLGATILAAVSADECTPFPALTSVPNVGYTPGNTLVDSPNITMFFSRTTPVPAHATLEAVVFNDNDCFTGDLIANTSGAIHFKAFPSVQAFTMETRSSDVSLRMQANFSHPFFTTGDDTVAFCVQFQSLVCGRLLDFVDVAVNRYVQGWYVSPTVRSNPDPTVEESDSDETESRTEITEQDTTSSCYGLSDSFGIPILAQFIRGLCAFVDAVYQVFDSYLE